MKWAIGWFVAVNIAAGGAHGADPARLPLIESGKLHYTASGDFRPFSYVDDKQQLAGFDIEVGAALARELGLEPVALKYKFAAIVEGVKAGRFDLGVASHTITAERLVHVDFSSPYYYSGPQVFVRPGLSLSSPEDLRGMEIAVSKGSTYVNDASVFTTNLKIYDSDLTALEALAAGRHDAVITDFVTGKMAIKEGLNLATGPRLGSSEQAIVVAKSKPDLLAAVNKALAALRRDGTLTKLSQKYFGSDITTPPADYQTRQLAAGNEQTHGAVSHFFVTLWSTKALFLQAGWITLQITVCSLLLGCVLGLVGALLKLSRFGVARAGADLYIYLVRGTPLIVQIFVLYFGMTNFIKIDGFWAASIALAVHNGGYIAEIFRGAISSIDKGQWEAARSLGMSLPQTYQRVILPQAGLRALPPLGNQFIIALKDSSLAAFISINELFNVATTQGANHFDQMTYLLVVAVYYLVLVLVFTMLVARLERYLDFGREPT